MAKKNKEPEFMTVRNNCNVAVSDGETMIAPGDFKTVAYYAAAKLIELGLCEQLHEAPEPGDELNEPATVAE